MKQSLVLCLLALSLPGLPTARATDQFVNITGSSFSPAALTIAVGDTITWENNDPSDFPHTTTSTLPISNPNYWSGTLPGLGDTFSLTFNNVGTFAYRDAVDGFTGTITVAVPAVPPTLANPRRVAGQFVFDVNGLTAGKTNWLQASTNLTSWVAIKTNVAASATMTFTNALTPPRRFFRVAELP